MSEVQLCTTERPQLFEFEVATCRTCRLRSKKAILEVATSNLQKKTGLRAKLGSLHANLTPPTAYSAVYIPVVTSEPKDVPDSTVSTEQVFISTPV